MSALRDVARAGISLRAARLPRMRAHGSTSLHGFCQSREVAHYFRFREVYEECRYGPHDTPSYGLTGSATPQHRQCDRSCPSAAARRTARRRPS
jgi:hypothetical protein